MITFIKWLNIDLTILREIRKQALKNLIRNIKCLKREYVQAFKIWLKYIKLGWILMNETHSNLDDKIRVIKQAYTLVKLVFKSKIPYFLRLKIFYLKDSLYQLLEELSIKLIDLTELTIFMRKNL